MSDISNNTDHQQTPFKCVCCGSILKYGKYYLDCENRFANRSCSAISDKQYTILHKREGYLKENFSDKEKEDHYLLVLKSFSEQENAF